jgi:hypothetical protein
VARSGCLPIGYLLLSGSSCLLYTDPINQPPKVTLTGSTQTIWRAAERPKYHAQAHDPDQSADSLVYEWRRQLGACPAAADVMVGAPVGQSRPDFENDLDFTDQFCVWVVVRDKAGATDYATAPTRVQHQPTVAVIDVVQPVAAGAADHFPLFSLVQLSGARSDDPESDGTLTYQWTITRGGETLTATPCPEPADSDVCFLGDKEGMYLAELSVGDPRGNKTLASKTVIIDPDRAPCIVNTEPNLGLARITRDATDENSFEVKAVSDDVDPFPSLPVRPSIYGFNVTWWMAGEDPVNPSGRRPTDQGQIPRVTFGRNYFRNGDQAYVRIQVNDRVMRDFGVCAPEKANCALDPERPTCFQWVTWKIDFRLLRDM